MAHSVISGKGGAIDGVGTVRKWTLSASAAVTQWVASGSKQGSSRVAGAEDWSATYDAYGHTPAHLPGDSFTFSGSYDGTNGWTGPGKVESVTLNWNHETGEPISHTVAFSSNGAITLGAVAATDATTPEMFPCVGCIIKASDPLVSPSFTEIEDIQSATLTITRALKAYSSSGTVDSGRLRTKRVTGGPWDFTFSYSQLEGDPALLFESNTVKHFQVFINDTLYWELKWARATELSGIETDYETGELIGATQNWEMEGWTDVEGSQAEGKIAAPAPTTWWPE